MNSVQCSYPAVQPKLNSTPYTQNTAHKTVHTAHKTLHTAHKTLHTAHKTVHTALSPFPLGRRLPSSSVSASAAAGARACVRACDTCEPAAAAGRGTSTAWSSSLIELETGPPTK